MSTSIVGVGGGGGGIVAKRYDGFCRVILMAYLVANVHGCKKHYKQFTNRIIILLKNKQKARNKRNVNKTKHYISTHNEYLMSLMKADQSCPEMGSATVLKFRMRRKTIFKIRRR